MHQNDLALTQQWLPHGSKSIVAHEAPQQLVVQDLGLLNPPAVNHAPTFDLLQKPLKQHILDGVCTMGLWKGDKEKKPNHLESQH